MLFFFAFWLFAGAEVAKMAFRFIELQQAFKLTLSDAGLPVGEVIALGYGRWLAVCPLCGYAHDVTTFTGDVYTPRCAGKLAHPQAYANWLTRVPDVKAHTQVFLKPLAEPTAAPVTSEIKIAA